MLIDGEYFVAHDVNLPDLYFPSFDPELDHSWHEFICVEKTEDLPTDVLRRTIEAFTIDIAISFELIKS